mgnify:CR=1 FL=1
MSKLPNNYNWLITEFDKVMQAHQQLGKELMDAGPIDQKTCQLIKLAGAAANRSEGAVHSHIKRALKAGADIVVSGRVADAALVAGPAAWHFDWQQEDWDRLAGAYAAGHIIECGAQCTGGNYSFMDEVPSFSNVGFPIAEMF